MARSSTVCTYFTRIYHNLLTTLPRSLLVSTKTRRASCLFAASDLVDLGSASFGWSALGVPVRQSDPVGCRRKRSLEPTRSSTSRRQQFTTFLRWKKTSFRSAPTLQCSFVKKKFTEIFVLQRATTATCLLNVFLIMWKNDTFCCFKIA